MDEHSYPQLIVFDKIKFIFGCILAIAILTICTTFYSWKAGIVFSAFFIIIGAFKINPCKHTKFLEITYCILSMFSTCFISQFLLEAGGLWKLETSKIALELACSAIIFLFVYIISLNLRGSSYISSFILIVLSLANYYVVKFRGNELVHIPQELRIRSGGTERHSASS